MICFLLGFMPPILLRAPALSSRKLTRLAVPVLLRPVSKGPSIATFSTRRKRQSAGQPKTPRLAPRAPRPASFRCWMMNVGCWMFRFREPAQPFAAFGMYRSSLSGRAAEAVTLLGRGGGSDLGKGLLGSRTNRSAACIRTTFSSKGDGLPGCGPPASSPMFRAICKGVMPMPHGKPHQPKTLQKRIAPNCRLLAHDLQDSAVLELDDVTISADQTWCDL